MHPPSHDLPFSTLHASIVTDRKSIETTVQQVADGEISLQQATERLLVGDEATLAKIEESPTNARETECELLTSLIERLGHPPTDIANLWCQQFRESLQTSPQPIEGFELADFEVTSNGQLRFTHQAETSRPSIDPTLLSTEQIEALVNTLRQQLVDTKDDAKDSVTLRDSTDQASPTNDDLAATEPSDRSRWTKVAMVAGIALCAGALFWIVRANSTTTVAETDTMKRSSRSEASGNVFAEFPSTRSRSKIGGDDGFIGSELFAAIDNNLADSQSSNDSLQTLQSLEQTSDEEIAMLEADAAPKFSLEDLVPSVPDPTSDDEVQSQTKSAKQTRPSVQSSNNNDQQGVSPQPEPTGDEDSNQAILSDDSLDGDQPDELQQPTHNAISGSIELPPMDQTDPMVIDDQFSIASTTEKLTLKFPTEMEMTIQPRDDSSGWSVVEKKGSKILAKLDVAKNNLTFAWAEGAEKISGSRSLHHGRIISSDGSAFFLRPEIEAESWQIRLDRSDMRPTWNLGSPLPPSVTRLSVDIDLPEDLEMTWVEPIPMDSPRRARGLAILKTLDGESVDLAIKFDVRCSRKMSCRLRYAARLDSSMPWQLVSRDLLDQFASQLAGREALVSREADRLQNVYDLAGTRGKRIIRIKQKYNDGLADSLRQYVVRVAELQSLIARVENNAAIRFRIWVVWPSGDEQTVFVTAPQ